MKAEGNEEKESGGDEMNLCLFAKIQKTDSIVPRVGNFLIGRQREREREKKMGEFRKLDNFTK